MRSPLVVEATRGTYNYADSDFTQVQIAYRYTCIINIYHCRFVFCFFIFGLITAQSQRSDLRFFVGGGVFFFFCFFF